MCAQGSIAHAVPNRDKLAAHAVSVSCHDTDELRCDMGSSYYDLTLSRPKIFVSRPSFDSLHISLSRQGKVLSRHKVHCCLYSLSRQGIFFHTRSLSRLKSLFRDRKIPSSKQPLSRHGKSYRDTKPSAALIPCVRPEKILIYGKRAKS